MTPEALSEFTLRIGVARQKWPAGPWDNEPDRLEWRHNGIACLVVRGVSSGVLCGYAAVPPDHPLHGKDYDDIDDLGGRLECHGGLTFSAKCVGPICHVPQAGESDDVWWFGFDCVHFMDVSPGLLSLLGPGDRARSSLGECYRSMSYVQRQVESLADQLRAWPA